MYLGTEKIDRIEGSEVILEGGRSLSLSEKAQSYLITEEQVSEEEYYMTIDKKIIKEVFEVIKNIDIEKLLIDGKKYQRELDQEFVNVAAEVIKVMTEFDFPIDRLETAFMFMKGAMDKINILSRNNLTSIENMILAKALKLDNEGKTDESRLRAVRISHYIEYLKNNS